MSPDEAIARIAQSTAQAGMNPIKTRLLDGEVLVARTSKFRLRWFATKLHTFLIASRFLPGTTTPGQLDFFLRAAAEHAKANKGGLPLGLQTGVAVLVVAVTEQADPAAREWASTPHGRQWATLPFPVLVETATAAVTYPQRLVIGGIYAKYLVSLVDQHVTTALDRPAQRA